MKIATLTKVHQDVTNPILLKHTYNYNENKKKLQTIFLVNKKETVSTNQTY